MSSKVSNVFSLDNFANLAIEGQFSELAKILEFHDKSFENNGPKICQQVQNLDMRTNTLLFFYSFAGIQIDANNLLLFDRLLKVLDGEQGVFCVKKIHKIAKNYYDFLELNKMGVKAIRAIQNVVQELNNANSGLTQIHILYLQICIENRYYKQALKVAQHPIVHIGKKNDVNDIDLCKFLYLSGEVLLVYKEYSEAYRMFKDITQYQTGKMHEVHIEAHKKLTLLKMRKGEFQEVEKGGKEKEREKGATGRHGQDTKIVEFACDSYISLQKKSNIQNLQQFDQFVQQNKELFTKEGNIGLVNQIRFAIVYHYLKNISSVYLRFRIPELYQKIQVDPTQVDIKTLVFEINKFGPTFSINQKLNCIEFKQQDEIDHEKYILNPLSYSLPLLKGVHLEFQKEYQEIIMERLKNPQTSYC